MFLIFLNRVIYYDNPVERKFYGIYVCDLSFATMLKIRENVFGHNILRRNFFRKKFFP